MTTTIEKIQHQIAENPILLYMKGSPKLPNCGFSAQAVQALSACGERFAYVDIFRSVSITTPFQIGFPKDKRHTINASNHFHTVGQ